MKYANFLVCDKHGIPKALVPPRTADKIVGDGYGKWSKLPDGKPAYVMEVGRQFSNFAMTLYLHVGDFLVEDIDVNS